MRHTTFYSLKKLILSVIGLLCVFLASSLFHGSLKISHIPASETQFSTISIPLQKEFTHFSSGTGFFVNHHFIVTSEHVVKDCRHIRVRGDIDPGYAKIHAVDSESDLALLVTNRSPSRIAPLRNEALVREGDHVVVVGYPLEDGQGDDYVVAQASITETNDNYSGKDRLQFTDSVSKGNSGGPLLDESGNVVGVIVGRMSYYLAGANDAVKKPVKTSSVAVNVERLKQFLDLHDIYYRTDAIRYDFKKDWVEQKAKEFVVNIHCVKG